MEKTYLKRLPVALAVVTFALFAGVVLSRAEKMAEPDPYAYRASIVALSHGDMKLTQDEYTALNKELQDTSLGGGVMQWHQNEDGYWVSEKNPGYPFLALPFYALGILRWAPLFYGLIGCFGLWIGARRWIGEWGALFAVGGYLSAAVSMVMAWRSTMPTFTDASLIALGIGALIWTTLAFDQSKRKRVIVGSIAFFALGLAFSSRYTNVMVLGVAALYAFVLCLRPRWGLNWKTLIPWGVAAAIPVALSAWYNLYVFGGLTSTGYQSTSGVFTIDSISRNLKVMPGHLWKSMPIFVVGLTAIAVFAFEQLHHKKMLTVEADEVREVGEIDPEQRRTDRWIGSLLIVSWIVIWGLYSMFEWTANMAGGAGPGGGPHGPGGMSGPTYSVVRFYTPVLGVIALLAAWLFTKTYKSFVVVLIVILFAVGINGFVDTTTGSWSNMNFGGGRGGTGGQNGQPMMPGQGGFAPNGGPPTTTTSP